MQKLAKLVKGRRGAISAVTLAVAIVVPVGVAVAHPGFPVSTAELDARIVWVSNKSQALAGRLSKPIQELNGAIQPATVEFDILQDSASTFIHDAEAATLSKIDPAFNSLQGETQVAVGAVPSYANGVIALTRPSDGALWIMFASQPLNGTAEPTKVLGANAQAVVTTEGTVLAYSPNEGTLFTIPSSGGEIGERAIPDPGVPFELTAVGEQAIILLSNSPSVLMPNGSQVELPANGLRIQQPGPFADSVLVATGDSLLEVPLGGDEPVSFSPGVETPATQSGDVAAPVRLDDCVYGAWASGAREVHQCGDGETFSNDIRQPNVGDQLVFRVNRSIIVLNNIQNGDSWLLEDEPILIANWDDVVPDKVEEEDQGDQEASDEAFEEEVSKRTEENTIPQPKNDSMGARPERATVLAVLDNDTDRDGDVLTISAVTAIPESVGTLAIVDAGRALQFTSQEGALGSVSARYTVTDGRPGGVAEAQLTIAVSPLTQNAAPEQLRVSAINLEQGQSITYNVLADWRDPDGDEVFLKSATSSSGDIVRRTPDGIISFSHTTAELGQKVVDVVVSDGGADTVGTMLFVVREVGALPPVGVPDFATTFVDRPVTIKPLENDRSPSGAPLKVVDVTAFDTEVGTPRVTSSGEFSFVAPAVGTYYLKYTLGAGAQTSLGLVRVDVLEDPLEPLPPVAVRDIAYLRPTQSVDLAVLQNDLSPSGRVLGITSVDVPADATTVTVEVLKNTLLRVSASEALAAGSFVFEYTISDGISEAKATVVIVPVPPLASNQPPLPKDDLVTVRAGDVVSVAVLENDIHPDGAAMHVAPDFANPLQEGGGFAFVADDSVRYQAPDTPGTYELSYAVLDDFQQVASAKIAFTVTAPDDESNRDPQPRDLEARLFSGSSFRIDVPLSRVDPDGDSVMLVGITRSPLYGAIIDEGSDWFRYQAYEGVSGTDEFTYQVEDAYGAIGLATVRIGVLPPPVDALPPSAVNDPVSLRPDRTGTVAVLGNDSDPSGYPLSLDDELVVPDGIEARIVRSQVVVTAAEEGLFTLGYGISNGHGGTDSGFVLVTIDKNAPLLPPSAIDHVVGNKEAAGKSSIELDPREGSENPAGLVADLEVGVVGPGASRAQVADDGTVTVQLGDTRRVIAYTLTSEDGLAATAFIVVPRRVSASWAPPPTLKDPLPEQTVNSGEQRTWDLVDIIDVPSGRAALVANANEITASNSDGGSLYVDQDTISFRSADGYAGPASINVQVTDGNSPADPEGNTAWINLPITVLGAQEQLAAIPPVFATRTIEVVVLESETLDLRAATDHPSDQVKNSLVYEDLTGSTSSVTASISGGTLQVSAAAGSKDETSTLTFRISGGGIEPIVASVKVIVVSSKAGPILLEQNLERYVNRTPAPETVTVRPLEGIQSPLGPDSPLTIIDAVIEENESPVGARITHTSDTLRLLPATGWTGTYSVLYTVRDETEDPARNVQARFSFIYWDVPDSNPVLGDLTSDNKVATVTVTAPRSNNSEITTFRVTASNAGGTQTCPGRTGCDMTFAGLTNGTNYTFTAQAENEVGWSAPWNLGSTTPWGRPPPPSVSIGSRYGELNLSWSADAGDAGNVARVEWQISGGPVQSSGQEAPPGWFSANPGLYSFQARSCSSGSSPETHCSAWSVSETVSVLPRPTVSSIGRGGDATITTSGDAQRILITFNDLPVGPYEFCGETRSDKVHWWWTTSPAGRTPGPQSRTECASATLSSNSSEPFGWVLKDAASGVYLGFGVRSNGNWIIPMGNYWLW